MLELETVEIIEGVIATVGTIIGAIFASIRLWVKHTNLKQEKEIDNSVNYLNNFHEYISDNEKIYLKKKINERIMIDATKEYNKSFRDVLMLLSAYSLDLSRWGFLKRIKSYIKVENEKVIFKVDLSYTVGFWIEITLAFLILLWAIFFSIATVMDYPNLFNSVIMYGLLFLIFILLIIVIRIFYNMPRKSKVEKAMNEINEEIERSKKRR